MSDIESMKAELEFNGYSVWGSVNPYRKPSHIETPDGFLFYGNPLNSEESQYAEVISKAYAHYQREKKFAAMEALLEDMLGNELYLDTDDRCHPSTQLMGWIRRAEELLK